MHNKGFQPDNPNAVRFPCPIVVLEGKKLKKKCCKKYKKGKRCKRCPGGKCK